MDRANEGDTGKLNRIHTLHYFHLKIKVITLNEVNKEVDPLSDTTLPLERRGEVRAQLKFSERV